MLRNVQYIVSGHFEMTDRAESGDNEGKFADMLRRRLEKGQNYHTPYLGAREFPARVRLIAEEEAPPAPISDSRSLGLMLYDIDYVTTAGEDGRETVTAFAPVYFMAEMRHGVIDLRGVEKLR